ERELENTVMLLARHFDQQLQQLELVQQAVSEQMSSAGVNSREEFERAMSGWNIHLMLKGKIEALPHIGSLSLNNFEGQLVNSANTWPVKAATISGRAYFQMLRSRSDIVSALSEPVLNHVTGAWTTV